MEKPCTESERSNSVDGGGLVCRICYRGCGDLFAPCNCRGTMALTHKECLERWLRERDANQCSVCLARYRVRRVHAPLRKFFTDSSNRGDVLRMAVNLVSAAGDMVVLVFAWSYAARFLGGLGWFAYLLVVALLVFQTIFWILVECARVWTCYEPVREWRKKAVTVDIITDDTHSISVPKEDLADVDKRGLSFLWKPVVPYRPLQNSSSGPPVTGQKADTGVNTAPPSAHKA
ncbi:E3 ubiquitin-protein ligase MARCHF2-like [Dermacentor albipictus]|uniref:E3 ubiquitin-protein ligase MARCHF2-like n=1 Tax=Dermacentor albipictus TaxID=60249 RepID=UPI0031FC2278